MVQNSHEQAVPAGLCGHTPIAPPASEEVDDQIDPDAEEGSHGTCQCHDQKGLVDHYTTPHHIRT
jgi:hypothetical protein